MSAGGVPSRARVTHGGSVSSSAHDRIPRPAPLAHPGRGRARPNHDRPRRHRRQHRPPLGASRPLVRRRLAPMGDHRVRTRVRVAAPAGRPDQRPGRPQAGARRRPAGLRGRVRRRRGGTEFRSAGRRARRAGQLCGAARPGRALRADDDVHRSRGASEGVRRLRSDRRLGGRGRPAARRRAHATARLALDDVREPRVRRARGARRRPAGSTAGAQPRGHGSTCPACCSA